MNWTIYYEHAAEDGSYAKTYWSTKDMIATITLCVDWDDLRPKNNKELRQVALHEIMHVLLAPLISEAEYRYSTQHAIDVAEHSIIRSVANICV